MNTTLREIIISISIVCVMLVIGFFGSNALFESKYDADEMYNKAIKIKSSELFQYGMKTSSGNAFVYGEMKAVDPVSLPEIKGKYTTIEKVKEIYTMHTRTVYHKVGKTSYTTVETYWTWDRAGTETFEAKTVNFCGVDFKGSQFWLPSPDYIETIKVSSLVRYKYYGSPTISKGTIFTKLENNGIGKEKVSYNVNRTIDETLKEYESNAFIYVSWIIWLIVTIFVVIVFCRSENYWLQ